MSRTIDPRALVRFDLNQGNILARGESQLLLNTDILGRLLDALPSDALQDFGSSLGHQIGSQLESRFNPIARATIQDIANALGFEFALLGGGNLSFENWGQSMVIRIVSPLKSPAYRKLLGYLLQTALVRMFSREIDVVPLNNEDNGFDYAVLNRTSGQSLRDALASGLDASGARDWLRQCAIGGAA